ncbi:MAG: hypothetical protein AAGA54_27450 [Myxococcota bacterium]
MRPLGLAAAALVGLCAAAVPSAVRACSCMRPPPPMAAADDAAVVFEGRPSEPKAEGVRLRYTFEVLRTFKGEATSFIDVVTMDSGAACGRRYTPGETYLVYAFEARGEIGDNLCSRTRRSADAREDFMALGEGVRPPSASPEPDEPSTVEPPRIEPVSPEVPPAQPGTRGCAASIAGLSHAPSSDGLALLLLLGVASLRRRPYRGG